jgi:hypothetical protein
VSIPIIRLEVEGMKASILAAFTAHVASLDADIQAAVDDFCRPANIAAVVTEHVNAVIAQAVREEVERFYRYGEGRRAVARAVAEALT